jgi:hypothetical protein
MLRVNLPTFRCYGKPKVRNNNDESETYNFVCIYVYIWKLTCIYWLLFTHYRRASLTTENCRLALQELAGHGSQRCDREFESHLEHG